MRSDFAIALAELQAAINHYGARLRNPASARTMQALARIALQLERERDNTELALMVRMGVCERCEAHGLLMPAHAICSTCAPFGVCECGGMLGIYDDNEAVGLLCPSCDAELLVELDCRAL